MEQPTASHPSESRAAKVFRDIFESGRPLLYVRSAEEQRVGRVLREAGQKLLDSAPVPVWTWSLTEGLLRQDGAPQTGTQAPRDALDFIATYKEPAIFHLKDFHEPLRDDPNVRRRLRDLYDACLDQHKFVVISSPVRFVPEEVERDLVYIELRLPDFAELTDFLREEANQIAARGANADTSDATIHQLARALQGLTLNEARHAVRRALATTGHLGPESMPALLEEKRLLVNRSGVVEFVASGTEIAQIGGLEDPQGVAAGAQEALSTSRQPDHGYRAQGRADDGDSGLRKKSVGQGHRLAL